MSRIPIWHVRSFPRHSPARGSPSDRALTRVSRRNESCSKPHVAVLKRSIDIMHRLFLVSTCVVAVLLLGASFVPAGPARLVKDIDPSIQAAASSDPSRLTSTGETVFFT